MRVEEQIAQLDTKIKAAIALFDVSEASIKIFAERVNKLEARIKSIEEMLAEYRKTRFSTDYTDFQIRFEAIEKRIQALEGREQTQ